MSYAHQELLVLFWFVFWLLAFYGIVVWWFEYNSPQSKYREFLELSVSQIGTIVSGSMVGLFFILGYTEMVKNPLLLFVLSVSLGVIFAFAHYHGRDFLYAKETSDGIEFDDENTYKSAFTCIFTGIMLGFIFVFIVLPSRFRERKKTYPRQNDSEKRLVSEI